MRTGTDASIPECRVSGYPVVDHGKLPMKPQKLYRLTISNPQAWNDSGTRALVHRPLVGDQPVPIWKVDSWFSYQDLWEQFERGGQPIKDFCDWKSCPLPHPKDGMWDDPEQKPKPTFEDFVALAGIVDGYQGIQ